MWKIDPLRGCQFSDKVAGLETLFEGPLTFDLEDRIVAAFSGQLVPIEKVEEFVLLGSPFAPEHLRKPTLVVGSHREPQRSPGGASRCACDALKSTETAVGLDRFSAHDGIDSFFSRRRLVDVRPRLLSSADGWRPFRHCSSAYLMSSSVIRQWPQILRASKWPPGSSRPTSARCTESAVQPQPRVGQRFDAERRRRTIGCQFFTSLFVIDRQMTSAKEAIHLMARQQRVEK